MIILHFMFLFNLKETHFILNCQEVRSRTVCKCSVIQHLTFDDNWMQPDTTL